MVRRLQRSALPLGARFIASRAKSSAPAVRFELEQRWRAGDPFVVEELRALYGDALTVRDLLR